MPLYAFELNDGECPITDEAGVWLADREHALEHAEGLARELMRAREAETRCWRLNVYEDGLLVHELRFARVDPTLDHLHPALRARVEELAQTLGGFKEAVSRARKGLLEARAVLARAQGRPYLATRRGELTIRSA